MIPSPDTPRESAEFCMEVFHMVSLDAKRIAELFVDSLETYLINFHLNEDFGSPDDPDEEEAFNRFCNRTFGFVKILAIKKPATAGRMYAVLAEMRNLIETGDGADQLYNALGTIAEGGRDSNNMMLKLIRDLKKV